MKNFILNVEWKPNKSLKMPLFRQIVNYIKNKISGNEWPVGSKLPSQRELAKLFSVNRSTVVEALDELKAQGLIETSSGGTIISNNTWSLLAANSAHSWNEYIENGVHKPNLTTIQRINRLEFKQDIIRLGTGELSPEMFPREMMGEILSQVSNSMVSLGYEEPKGSLELRTVLSEYVKRYGINADPNSILIVSGSLQALQLISVGILHSGATVLVENPSYLNSLNVFQSAGIKLKGIPLDEDGIEVSKISEHIDSNTSLIYTIPTFHNPTGIVMSESRRLELLDVCERERLPIIEDDAYRELWLEDEPPLPLKARDKNGIVLYMGTISKSLFPGLRIGWLVGPEPVIDRLGDVKMQMDYGASSLSQITAARWISDGSYDIYISELRNKLRLRRKIALEALEKYFYDIAKWTKPRGGFYIWLSLNNQVSMEKLFTISSENGILINPGNIYAQTKNSNIRISYSYASLEDIDKGLKKLSEIIRKLI